MEYQSANNIRLMLFRDYFIYIFLAGGMVLSIVTRKLTVVAAITGMIVGLLVYKGAGYTGISMLALFFILGSGATGWQFKRKLQEGIAEENKGKRTAGQVIANGGLAAISGLLGWIKPEYTPMVQLMIAGSLAAATADTLSSELGSIYGSRFYDIVSFKKTKPGPDGVVSIEGTLIGISGTALIALTYSIGFGFNYFIGVIIAAGTIGNIFDSVLGATLERSNLISNNTVNFLNTLVGALICLVCYLLIH